LANGKDKLSTAKREESPAWVIKVYDFQFTDGSRLCRCGHSHFKAGAFRFRIVYCGKPVIMAFSNVTKIPDKKCAEISEAAAAKLVKDSDCRLTLGPIVAIGL